MAWFRKSRPNTGPAAKPPAPGVERLETRDQPAANLLADLNPAPGSAFDLPYSPAVGGPFVGATVGGTTYFAADDGTHPAAVWKSDGTPAGTKMVAELPGGTAGGFFPFTSLPSYFTAAGGKVYFTYDDREHGNELWVTDGTKAGTKMVADLNPGAAGGSPWPLAAVGGKLVFVARPDGNPFGWGTVFASDGTEAGTVALKALGADTFPAFPGFVTSGGKFYFAHRETDPNSVLPTTRIWATDGTPAGTKAFATLPAGVDPATLANPTAWLTAVGSKVYFSAGSPATGAELWVSDGTTAGTKLVKDINTTPFPGYPGSQPLNFGSGPQQFAAVGKTLYFVADDGKTGQELWRSDGTAAGTKLLTDLTPGAETYPNNPYGNPGGTGSKITGLRAVGDLLYFAADDGKAGPQLYVSNGTAVGTVALTAVEHTPDDFTTTNPYPGTGYEGFDRPAAAEFMSTNPYPGPVYLGEAPAVLSATPGEVLFAIGDKAHGRQLWVTDGTKGGTKMVRQIGDPDDPLNRGVLGPVAVGESGGKLVFHAYDAATGRQLWATDGTAAGTGLVAKINTTTLPSAPQGFVSAGGLAYFTADYGVYATDGKSAPRLLTKLGDLHPWITPLPGIAETPAQFTASGKGAYFVSRAGAAGLKLWRTDGTAAGTVVVKEVPAPTSPAELWSGTPFGIDNPTDVNGALYFTLDTRAAGQQLWKSDGTAKGTVLVRQLNAASSLPVYGLPGSIPPPVSTLGPVRQMTAVGGRLFFVAGGAAGEELWVSDGTAAGTKQVKDLNPGAAGSLPDDLTALGGKVYFNAAAGTTGRQLYVSDGTAAGTKRVAAINPGGPDVPPPPRYWWGPEEREMVAAGGSVFFPVYDFALGDQLWASDGTEKGTRRVSNLSGVTFYPGMTPDTQFDGLTAAGGKVVFAAYDAKYGRQMFVSDGTDKGTKMLGPIGDGKQASLPGWSQAGANPLILAADGGRVYFAADDGKAGRELWVTDGTTPGTKLVRDFTPGPAGGLADYQFVSPRAAVVNGRLVLGADDGRTGSEPWAVVLPATPTTPPTVPPGNAAVVAAMKVSATEGTAFDTRLASVTLPPAADYRVTLLWGDGRSSAGTLTRNTPTGRTYTVTGGHKYAAPGTYTVRVTVTRAGRTVLAFDTTATVGDARFYAGRVAQRVAAGSPFSGVVATITDTNPAGGKASDFTATVNWGDGTTAPATVRRTAAGKFEVVADTTFAAAGRRTVTVTITSVAAGKTATAESIFIIDPARPVRTG